MTTTRTPRYTRTDCDGCDGTGNRHDPTNADKVNPGPSTCMLCQGRGYRETLIPDPEHVAYETRLRDSVRAAVESDPDAELPAWML
jgi:hypothetical protein